MEFFASNDQTTAFEKIGNAEDQQCEILQAAGKSDVLGGLVFKLRASDEYATQGIRHSLLLRIWPLIAIAKGP